MREHGYVEGTAGITYVHKTDDRRHRKRCTHYHKDGSCAYMSRCGGAAHCQFYSETEYKSDEVYVRKAQEKHTIPEVEIVPEKEMDESAVEYRGVQTICLADIIVPDKFLRKTPDAKKVAELHDYYNHYKKLDKPIYVSVKDGKYYLVDKYLRYYVAKELGKTWINARVGTYEESIVGDKLLKIGSRVQHRKYGMGTVVSNDGKYVAVSFDIGKDVRFDFDLCIRNKVLR